MKKPLYILLLFLASNLIAQEYTPYDLLEVDSKLLTVNNELAYKDNCITLYADETPLDQIDFIFKINSGKKITINWGDGNDTVLIGTGENQAIQSNYIVTKDSYKIEIYGPLNEVIYFEAKNNTNLGGNIKGLNLFSNLSTLRIEYTNFYGNINDFLAFQNLETLIFHHNYDRISGEISELSILNNLVYCYASMTYVDFSQITTFDLTGTFYFQNCYWISANVDNCIISFANGTKWNGILNVAGANEARTHDTDDDIEELEDRGWTVTRNDPE